MKRKTIDSIFVLTVFVIAYSVVVNNSTVSGKVISLPEFTAEEIAQVDAYTVRLDSPMNLEIRGLTQRTKVVVKDGDNQYSFEVWHLVQDYKLGEEYVNIWITPGDKRVRLVEKSSVLVDFNNDGRNEALITLEDIAHGEATIIMSTP